MIKENKIKKVILSLLLYTCLSTIQAQEIANNTNTPETQADKDLKELYDLMGNWGTDYQSAIDAGVIEMRRHEDTYAKKRSRLAKAFFENYPEDERRLKALYAFFNAYALPHFIPDVISDSITNLINNIPRGDKRIRRLIPINDIAMEDWRELGDEMVASIIINSKVPLELKEVVEFQLISREVYINTLLSFGLEKEVTETDYWNRFEVQYWKNIYLLLENHVDKYAELEIVASRVQNILTVIKTHSSTASDAYWQYFYEITGANRPKADQSGIKALHKLAAKNVAAIENLKEVDFSKPLEMTFMDMYGTKIDLTKMRGKVVLIDFWATYCGPCIKEMPHVRTLYDKYKDQGFEVIGIAAEGDDAKDRINTILQKTGANWPQRLDKGADASVNFHALYRIKSLPTVWLLNKEGVIVDRNARGGRLEPLIRKYLKLE